MKKEYARIKNNLKEIGETNWKGVKRFEGRIGKIKRDRLKGELVEIRFNSDDQTAVMAFYESEIERGHYLELKIDEVLEDG